ncbi:MAG: hypothetical protein ACRDZN_02515 [Acidimicrobiales bacterium]
MDRRLGEYARKTRAKKSTVVVVALQEWLRMQDHPGIVFVASSGERRAALASGPQVWTVAEAWQQHNKKQRSAEVVADAVGLSVREVEAALAYWADNRNEIDEQISRHQAEQDEALEAWERRRSLDAI